MQCEVISAAGRNPLKEFINSASVPFPHSRKDVTSDLQTPRSLPTGLVDSNIKSKGKINKNISNECVSSVGKRKIKQKKKIADFP